MATAVFIGTFDPFHGAHIGQLLRAHHYKPLTHVKILVDKHPLHKPNAAPWEHRLAMAKLTLAACELPFTYDVVAVENSMALEVQEHIDYKVTGIDSLLDNVTDRSRWPLAQRWPMIVLSIPGIPKASLDAALKTLPSEVRKSISYEYVSIAKAPGMNYDFEKRAFMFRRIHSTYIREGREKSLIPKAVQQYIRAHNLYTPNA